MEGQNPEIPTEENEVNDDFSSGDETLKRFITIATFRKHSGQSKNNMIHMLRDEKITLVEFPHVEGRFIDTEAYPISKFLHKSKQV